MPQQAASNTNPRAEGCRACDHALVLPLLVGLRPDEHPEAAAAMLSHAISQAGDDGNDVRDAWAKFRSDVPSLPPSPMSLRDDDLYVIRDRYIAHPVLGLMWAAAQELEWGKECDGWRNIGLVGVDKGASIRVAWPNPERVQTSVPCTKSYASSGTWPIA